MLLGGLSSTVLLAVLEVLSRTGAVDNHVFPPVTLVADQLLRLLGEASYWTDVGSTMWAWLLGIVLSVLIAIPVGMLLGSVSWSYEWFHTTIEFLRPIPPVALIPLAVLIFGPTPDMKVFLICVASVWPLLFQTMYGVRDVDRVLAETAHAYRMPAAFRARYVVLPSTLPYMVTGLRISATVGLIVAIAAELVSGAAGLGASIRLAQAAAAPTLSWALIFTVGLIGVAINSCFRSIERKLLHWHASQRQEARL